MSNTYYYDPNQNIPKSDTERRQNEIKYYQWVQLVLLVQALLFYMPRVIWRSVSIKAGLNICDLVSSRQIDSNRYDNMKLLIILTNDCRSRRLTITNRQATSRIARVS